MLHTVSGDILLRRFLGGKEQWNMTLGRSLSPGGGMVFSEKTGLYGVYFGISGMCFRSSRTRPSLGVACGDAMTVTITDTGVYFQHLE
jgi:hypothetical protein